MAAILCTKYGELFAYLASIVRADRNCEGKLWVAYDCQYRRQALARRDLNWSVPDPRLYNEAFTGRARPIARCSYCLQDDHLAQQCPRNPYRPMFGWFPDPSDWPNHASNAFPGPLQGARAASGEICRRFNEGRCRYSRCRFRHACSDCGASHPLVSCPKNPARSQQRSRSPQPARSPATPTAGRQQ